MPGATSFMYGSIDNKGNFTSKFYCDGNNMLNREQIIALIKNPPSDLHDQPEPFWCSGAILPHRYVYFLDIENWFFPCYRDLQMGRKAWRLKSSNAGGNFTNTYMIAQSEIWGGNDHRFKTLIIDNNGNVEDNLPNVFDFYINIWKDPSDPNSWKTPITIDPGTSGGAGQSKP